ncbi:MBL fold metallo-hydrolase [Patescibacteria group bacterium]|nr:MBL fold metallo-hydrolase [Patescibacteria group bacterium]
MIITYYGLSSFKIQSKQNGSSQVIINPFSDKTGLKGPKTDAEVLIIGTNEKYITKKNIIEKPFIIDCAGEYDVEGIGVKGVETKKDEKQNIIYRIAIDGITIIHLGHLNKILSSEELEELSGTDILLVPVGGNGVLNASKAKEVINQIEPRIIIPMLYKIPGLIFDFDEISNFIKEIGLDPTNEEKLKITKKDLPQEDMELVILNVK